MQVNVQHGLFCILFPVTTVQKLLRAIKPWHQYSQIYVLWTTNGWIDVASAAGVNLHDGWLSLSRSMRSVALRDPVHWVRRDRVRRGAASNHPASAADTGRPPGNWCRADCCRCCWPPFDIVYWLAVRVRTSSHVSRLILTGSVRTAPHNRQTDRRTGPPEDGMLLLQLQMLPGARRQPLARWCRSGADGARAYISTQQVRSVSVSHGTASDHDRLTDTEIFIAILYSITRAFSTDQHHLKTLLTLFLAPNLALMLTLTLTVNCHHEHLHLLT